MLHKPVTAALYGLNTSYYSFLVAQMEAADVFGGRWCHEPSRTAPFKGRILMACEVAVIMVIQSKMSGKIWSENHTFFLVVALSFDCFICFVSPISNKHDTTYRLIKCSWRKLIVHPLGLGLSSHWLREHDTPPSVPLTGSGWITHSLSVSLIF